MWLDSETREAARQYATALESEALAIRALTHAMMPPVDEAKFDRRKKAYQKAVSVRRAALAAFESVIEAKR